MDRRRIMDMEIVDSQAKKMEGLWDQYCCRLLGFIRKRVSDEIEAEDILQEVFVRAHRGLCCVPMPDRVDRWLFQVARNLIIDHYRSRKEMVEIPESLPTETEFPEEDPETELAFSLQDMIHELPAPYREALILTEYQGLSQKELAESQGISLSGAKSRVQRAREKLREMLMNCCHFEFDRRGRVVEYYQRCCCCAQAEK